MRVLRDCRQHCVCAAQITYSPSPTPQRTSLSSSVGNFWDEWQIQCLILVSFGLQVFLFLATGMRRRSVSRILRSLLWLAYLLADSVAIFVLGHLALHANGPEHQLLFFWAPFVLLHLGGQDTITALSMQDNDLWTRHLLGLVTQVAAAAYVISRISWPDRRLRAAMVLMFLSGCFKYVERTVCLYRASPTRLTESSLVSWVKYVDNTIEGAIGRHPSFSERFREMVKTNGRRHSSRTFDVSSTSSGILLVLDNPINDVITKNASSEELKSLLQGLKSNEDPCRVYNYVGIRPVIIYELLYTKASLRFTSLRGLTISFLLLREVLLHITDKPSPLGCFLFLFIYCIILLGLSISTLLLFFPLLSISTVTVLFFKVVEKGQLYSRADVIVSYILLIGAIIMEVASLVISILSYVDYRDIFASKQWSEMLGQYNMAKTLTGHDTTCIMSLVPRWIGKHLDENTSRIPISEDLKKFVLDKLCDFGTREQDWNFATFHGKLALEKWMDKHNVSVSARLENPLNSIINDLDISTSVLILHIATDILYLHDNKSITPFIKKKSISSEQQTQKKIIRELSNYMMYLVFKCGVMLTGRTKLLHERAQKEIEAILEERFYLDRNDAITRAFEANRGHGSLSEQAAQVLLLMDTFKALKSSLFPCASHVAHELIDIHGEEDYWDLVAAVWVEMLYYIAPRCGGAFHSHHLTTGGEFITQVLFLMHLLGPFLPPPGA